MDLDQGIMMIIFELILTTFEASFIFETVGAVPCVTGLWPL
jgi:hypothetical protein